jgi:hypothetical protein
VTPSEGSGYRDLSSQTRFLKILLGSGAALAALALVSSFLQAELLGRSFTEAEGQANDSRQQVIGILQVVLYFLTAVFFGRWIYRAQHNVRALGAAGLAVSPGWAVGYFFVPVVNLWKPYQAMKELWRASKDPAAWQGVSVASILPLWWTLWLGSNVLGQVSFRLAMSADTLDDFKLATNVEILSGAVDIVLCLAALTLVSRIWRAQVDASVSEAFD